MADVAGGEQLDARRQRIIAGQLKSMGYAEAEVEAALPLGAAGVARLRAKPPSSSARAEATVLAETVPAEPVPARPPAATAPCGLLRAQEPSPAPAPAPPPGSSGSSSQGGGSSSRRGPGWLPEVDLSWLTGLAAPEPEPPATSGAPRRASGVPPSSSSGASSGGARSLETRSTTFQAVAEAQQQTWHGSRKTLLNLGYSKMQVAWALDEAEGDLARALQALQQSGSPAAPAPASSPSAGRLAAVQGKSCIFCASDASRCEGLACPGEGRHFLCDACFTSFAEERSKEGRMDLRCPAPACNCSPWSYAEIAQHLPDRVFGELLSSRERQRERAYKEREGRLRAEASRFAAPDYWSNSAPSATQRWSVVPVERSEWDVLSHVVQLPPGHSLGGRDQRLAGSHSSFKLGQAWRIENHSLFAKYAAERLRLRGVIAASKARVRQIPKARVREPFWKALGHFTKGLDGDVNELYLTHGTKPDVILSVISGGLNERYSGGIFGHGTYFAEDLGKNDQYVTEDTKFGDHAELHRELYRRVRHPGKVYYVFLCRLAFGHFCTTQDARTDQAGQSIWSSAQRELAYIPNVSPPEPFHGLLGETGAAIQRYREFITFHGDRIYPEYLLAYHRC